MAPNDSSSEKPEPVANCSFIQMSAKPPFFTRPCKPNFVPIVSPNIIRDLHSSIVSATDEFLKLLHSFAFRNPVLKKVLNFHSGFHSFCREIRCGSNGSVNSLSNRSFAAILPGDSVAGIVVANGLMNFLNLYNTLLVVRLVLTWFPNSPPAIVSPLSTLCDPYLNIFRGIIPPLGGTLDLSPILAFLVLNAFTSTAAALPAELPVTGGSQESPSSPSRFTNLTSSQKKWMRRVHGNMSKSSTSVN